MLEAAAFVHRAGTPTRLVQRIVEEAIDRYAEQPTVRKALEAQREQAATEEGKLSHLATKQRRRATRTS